MGIRRNLSEVSERVGAGTADFYDKLADNVRQFACQLWSDFPDRITQNKNLAASFARGFMSSTCAAEGNLPTPPPDPNFNGGQCVGDRYQVRVTYRSETQDLTQTLLVSAEVYGPVTRVVFEEVIGQDPGEEFLVVDGRDISGNPITVIADLAGGAGVINTILDIENRNLTNSNDTCGDPPLQYPVTNPDPDVDYVTDITIVNEDGNNLTFPLVYAPIDFNFPMTFDLGGIDVVIDLGGIDFNFGPGGVGDGGGQLPDGQQDPLPIPKDNPGGGNTTRKFPPPNTEDFEEIIKQPSTEDTELEGELLDYVTLQLTRIPVNANTQVWVDGATVYYCGWFAFISDTFVFKREPIHFEFTIWNAPKGATGYQYQLYPGFQATATVYKRKINRDGST